MANATNRSVDFAPAWLKLPDEGKQQRQFDITSGHHNHTYRQPGNLHYNKSGHTNSHVPNRNGRQHVTRSVSQPSNNRSKQPVKSENRHSNPPAAVPIAPTPPASGPVQEEDFPCLGAQGSKPVNTNVNAQTNAQWKVKQTNTQRSQSESDAVNNANQQTKLLASNMPSSKVYRAHVKTIPRRTPIIPITNGNHPSTYSDEKSVSPTRSHQIHQSSLSSSVEKEKRLLEEMGWREDDSEDECEIPEQDPAQLAALFKEAKEHRERLLMKSKNLIPSRPVQSALPNEYDLDSSENSDAE